MALHSERFRDKAPAEGYATLLDEGVYLCSIRTMHRILAESGELKERRNQLRHPQYKKPELLATGPGAVFIPPPGSIPASIVGSDPSPPVALWHRREPGIFIRRYGDFARVLTSRMDGCRG